MAAHVGSGPLPTVARPVELEWSLDALADLDRFATFLHGQFPDLAARVANELIVRADVLRRHPKLGRPIATREGLECSFGCRCESRGVTHVADVDSSDQPQEWRCAKSRYGMPTTHRVGECHSPPIVTYRVGCFRDEHARQKTLNTVH